MELYELVLILAAFTALTGGMFSAIFGSIQAFWGTQFFAGLVALLGGLLYYYL